jgi:uncharacterized membrane protein YkvA (DUF1232 family)
MAELKVKQRMKSLLMFLPNLVMMSARLMVDPRVPKTERILMAGAVLYAVIPLDFIPDFIPFVGQVDDIYLVSLTVLRLVNQTDPEIVREHWRGGGDVVQLAEAARSLAPKFLPGRVRRVLESRVESRHKNAPDAISAVLGSAPLLVEIPDQSEAEK